jgi:formate-dependent nitrite reductase membrane component NrfD
MSAQPAPAAGPGPGGTGPGGTGPGGTGPGGGRDKGQGRTGRGGKRGGGRGRGGEEQMVPRAEFRSYYGHPVLQKPVWKSPEVPGYLFFGGLAGASSVLGAFAQADGNRDLARVTKIASVGAIGVSAVALVKDLGRPARFINMLRVFKTSSPMSVGSWLLTGYGAMSGAAAASEVTGLLPAAGAAATGAAALLGTGIATYTAALLCDTAVPAWHDGHREMPYLFAGSAASAAGGLGMLAVSPRHSGQAVRFALLGVTTELTAELLMIRRLGDVAEPYEKGKSGTLLRIAQALTVAGAGTALFARRHRAIGALAGATLLTASALTRFGIFEAGLASASDPRYTIQPQRERVSQAAAAPATS